MTKLLVATIKAMDGSEQTVKTYADDKQTVKKALKDIIGFGDKVVSYEWVDTLSGIRAEWNRENPDSPIPINS